jgi:hypothetical protein
MKIETFESFNPRIKRKDIRPYQLHVEYEHGDADFTTHETYSFSDKEAFDKVVNFFYDIMNFVPKSAYGNLGHFDPLPDKINAGYDEKTIMSEIEKISKKWGVNYEEYLLGDNHYDQGYAGIEGIKATINGVPKVFVFQKALETNKISLPNIGDTIDVNVNNIPGYGPSVFGGTWKDYLPNSGVKDYQVNKFKAKVIDCAINFYHDEDNEHYTEYTHIPYMLLLETEQDVLKPNHPLSGKVNKLVMEMNGWDPEFETKFNKDEYDGMNYYLVS